MAKKPQLKQPKESQIQKAILDWLRWQGVFCWKVNNAGIKKPNGGYIPTGKKGVSDIIGVLKGGIFLAIEVKRPGCYPSEFQKDFIKGIQESGGIAFVAHSVFDVELSLKEYFL